MSRDTILIVEDERAVARGLQYGLEREGFAVLLAETGSQALSLVERRSPELILLDIRLPDISGFDVCRRLRASGHRMPVLMLTALDEELDRVLGLELGADDYIVKPYSLREVVSRVRAQLRRAYGDLAMRPMRSRLQVGDLELDLDRLQVLKPSGTVTLTPLEFRLLHTLASEAGRPVSRERLIEAVWGYSADLGNERTVDAHVRHLRQKLEDNPADPRRLVTVRGVGYQLEL
ncbi:MAG: response regulator transcription factor [Anaerolineae bacterium]|jgi:DNA-binding response OmpR family regulator|nr:response regulator transcription factor [Anaerolineae bacterium]